MKQFVLAALVAMALVGLVSAQSTLAIGGTLNGGGNITVNVSGAPASSFTAVLVSQTAGTTNLGQGLTIGLAMPAIPLTVGSTDSTGSLAQSYSIPTLPTGATSQTFNLVAQAVTLNLGGFSFGSGSFGGSFTPPTLSWTTSNVVSFTLTL